MRQKLIKKIFIIGLISSLAVLHLYSFVFTPITQRVILKNIYAPAVFSVYSKDNGMLYCQLYGVASASKDFKRDCQITPKAIKEMRHFAMNYVRNKIFLEQQYTIHYQNGWCFLQNGGNLFNEEIIKDGYGVVQYFDTSQPEIIEKLEILENLARSQKRGLWKEWNQEMECLKSTLRQIAQESQK